ncbi:hypothetical protein D3C81_1262700 [compost metagenome]
MLKASWVRMPWLLAMISLPSSRRRRLLPTRCMPGCGFIAMISGSKASSWPRRASKLMALITSAHWLNRVASSRDRQLRPVMQGVPLTRHRPSLAPSLTGARPTSAKACCAGMIWPR